MAELPHLQRYGPWAVVTGASSGIGAETARLLARAGLNVVLASRRTADLVTLADELQRDHGVGTRVVTIDLATEGAAGELDDATADLDVGLLVSNAGWSTPGGFLGHEAEEELGFLWLNVATPMLLAHRFGRRFLSRDGDLGRRGGLVLTGSAAGYSGVANLAGYAAAKAYAMTLGEGLHRELGPHGVDVLVLSPGPTRTGMVAVEGMDPSALDRLPWMAPADVAEAGLRGLGRRQTVVPGLLNRIMMWVTRHLMSRRTAGALFSRVMEPAVAPEIRASAVLAGTGPRH